MLALEEEDEDDTPPTSPMEDDGRIAEYADNGNIKEGRDGKGIINDNRRSNSASPTTTPSMVDNQQIDACLHKTP